MKSPVVLVAAGGLAAEAVEAMRAGDRWEPVAVLDDDLGRAGDDVCGVAVVGGLDRLADHPGAAVVVCAGRGATRAALVERLRGHADGPPRYATVVHPDVRVPESVRVGQGSILLAGVVLTARVQVGEHVVVMPGAVLTHDDVVDDFATLCAGVLLGGHVRIGARAYLGMGSAVRERSCVGADATVGMGAAVLGDVAPGTTAIGVPAREREGVSSGVHG
ncbi:NeuD/PglB/VioB family sugar acetyltransferase [Aquipuribacter sp. MA13-6]|uniref:NeuD/PglB/VioB family sugar acetyltransferase n=1 Tax=unclassified Aquipuribacter TaxID=2635084 RepID=UPI003EF041F5